MPHIKKKAALSNRKRLALVLLCLVYLVFALIYSFMTPAWEANDEADHTIYAERIIEHHKLPRIGLQNGHESHQPPLYYVVLAGWQRVLHIPSFQPELITAPNAAILGPSTEPKLGLSHQYNHRQKQQAIYLHELRVLSVLCGLGTVIFTFLTAQLIFGKLRFSVSATLFVVLLPKELVVSSVVTNDSLVILLSSALIYLSVRLCSLSRAASKRYLFLLGMVAGAAVLTKLNSFPLVMLILVGVIIHQYVLFSKRFVPPILYMFGFLFICGWWLVFNLIQYGDPLAQTVSNSYLAPAIPGLIVPVSLLDAHRYLHFLPSELLRTAWYDGGWNQLIIPKWINVSLWTAAGASIFSAGIRLIRSFKLYDAKDRACFITLVLGLAAGALALYIIARTTVQGEGRVGYVGLSAFAILCTFGMNEAFTKLMPKLKYVGLLIWPLSLLLVDVYIFVHIILPLGSL